MNIESLTRLPLPPVDAVLSAAQQNVLLWQMRIVVLVLAAAVAYGIQDWRTTKSPVFLLLVLGGGLAVPFEPFNDILGGCWHPIIGQEPVFELMGRPMPLWVVMIYFAYYGVQAAVTYRILRSGIKARSMWLLFIVPVLVDIALEVVLMRWDLYYYYGNQPLVFFKFPLYWAVGNSAVVFMAAVVAVFAEPHLTAGKRLAMALIVPLSDAAFAPLVVFPSAMAVNSQLPVWATQASGIASFVIAFFLVRFAVYVLAEDSRGNLRRALLPHLP
jgi:hypothetical protein